MHMLIPAVPITKTLPLWVQITSFVFASVGFLGAAFVGLTEYLRTATLDIRVTKDSFYRLVEQGEAVFCRATLLARNGPILIHKVSLTLTKTDDVPKIFPLEVEHFGTLVHKNEYLFQEHNYYGRSAVHYLSADQPERLVYFCHLSGYAVRQNEVYQTFRSETLRLRGKLDLAEITATTAEQKTTIVKQLVEKHLHTIMASVQLEAGKFRLSIRVEYESTNARFRRWRQTKVSDGSIQFDLPASFRNTIQNLTENALTGVSRSILFDEAVDTSWPTFTPAHFIEN
jgi:hypothetical protein